MKELYRMHAEMCKVFTNPTRIEILNLLRKGEMSVTELVKKTELSQANISQHLSIMRSRGIVSPKRRGKNIYYKIMNKKIIKAFDIMRGILAEKLINDNRKFRETP